MTDMINNPPHYNASPARCSHCGEHLECIDVTRHMGFSLGNAVKYIWRFAHKNGLEDLKKARWYLEDAIKQMEKTEAEKRPAVTGFVCTKKDVQS